MSTLNDHHFDDLAVRFAQKIYGNNKGAIRLAVLQADLLEALPARPLRILDIGAGLGHMALWLAQQGHSVTLAEPSAAMLEQARRQFAAAEIDAHFLHCDWQHLAASSPAPFDLILCHAVLEWLAEPAALIATLRPLIKDDGWLSLAFYNKDALVLHNLIKGNLRKLARQRFAGDDGGLTPQQPLDPREIEQVLAANNWQIRQRSGIRVFHDYMQPQLRQKIADDELVATELAYRRHPALGPLGRYLHWMCRLG